MNNMKKLILISLVFAFTLQLKAEFPYKTIGVAPIGIVALGTMGLYFNYWYESDRNENGFYISPGIDIRMAVNGQFDMRTKVFYHYNHLEPFLAYETFPDNRYRGLSFGLDYLLINRKFGLLSGLETTRIWNYNSKNLHIVQSIGINTEIRYLINNRLSVSIIGNLKTRPEITNKIVYSNYLNINYRLF